MYELKHFNIPKDKSPCIYGIINPIDMKIYIGATKNVNKRARLHKSQLKAGKHPNKELQKDVNKGLRFFIIYKIPQEQLEYIYVYEKLFMIKAIKTSCKLYNIVGVGTQEKMEHDIVTDLIYKLDHFYNEGLKCATGYTPGNLRILINREKRFL